MTRRTNNRLRVCLRVFLISGTMLIVLVVSLVSPVQMNTSRGGSGGFSIVIGATEYAVRYDEMRHFGDQNQLVRSTATLELCESAATPRYATQKLGEIVAIDPPTHVQIEWNDGSKSAPMIARWEIGKSRFRSDYPAWTADGAAIELERKRVIRPGEWVDTALVRQLWFRHLAMTLGVGSVVLLFFWLLTTRRVWRMAGAWDCPHCGYDLRGCVESGCPECGFGRGDGG